jgi:hypothetical protein
MLHKYGEKNSINNKEVCLCINQLTVAPLQQTANYISLLQHKPIIRSCMGDTLSDKTKWKNLASAKTKIKTLDVILRCVRVTIGSVEKQYALHILSVSL